MGCMDLENIKMDWAPILEGYVRYLEDLYPDIPVRESFLKVIERLNSNEIKSRVILSGVNVAAYAYIMESKEKTDRIYGSIGFVDEKYCTEERINNLLEWVSSEAKKNGRYIMMNEIFNSTEVATRALEKAGFKTVIRERMEIDLLAFKGEKRDFHNEVEVSGINNLNIREFSRFEYEAYKDSEDFILFPTESADERAEMTTAIFKGQFGEVIPDASIVLRKGSDIVGAVIATDGRMPGREDVPILADVFVTREHRHKGYAKNMVTSSLLALKGLGHTKAYLSVNSRSNAKKLYLSLGFQVSEYGKETIFYKKP